MVIINVMDVRPPFPLNISYHCDTLKYFILPEFKKDISDSISKLINKIQVLSQELPKPEDKSITASNSDVNINKVITPDETPKNSKT